MAARKSPASRFAAKYVVQPNGCWEWVAARNNGGYGKFTISRTGWMLAHRWSYLHYVGPVPDGLQLDHLCRNRACVRPDHLEAVTAQVNLLRGKTVAASNAAKTHCPRGHELAGANLYRRSDGRRECRACIALLTAARAARLVAA